MNDYSEMGAAIAGILMMTTVITVLIWQIFGTWRARMAVSREEAYRQLAEKAITLQRRIAEDLTDVQTRMTAIERLMREVE